MLVPIDAEQSQLKLAHLEHGVLKPPLSRARGEDRAGTKRPQPRESERVHSVNGCVRHVRDSPGQVRGRHHQKI